MKCPKCNADVSEESHFCSKCGTPLKDKADLSVSQTKTIKKASIASGKTIAGKYRIIEEIGRGGMGIVYKAKDTRLRRTVALKFLPAELTQDKEVIKRFTQEAQTAASLDHPNICTVFEIDEADGQTFIAMSFIDGQSLKEKLEDGPLDVEEAKEIALQVAEGLKEAHDKGIVHRDIKPANIMLTDKGQAKITDFGLAKLSGGADLTKASTIMGTVDYMSPEQVQGKAVDHRSDIWSLGVVLYEMFGGRLPFLGETEASFLYSIVHEDPAPLKEVNPSIPLEVQKVISRAVKKKPEDRFQSAKEIAVELRRYYDVLKAEEAGAVNLRTFIRRLRQPKIAIPAVLAIASIAAITYWYFNRQAKINWARLVAIPEIQNNVSENNFLLPNESNQSEVHEIYSLAQKAEKYIPNDPIFKELLPKFSRDMFFGTIPPGVQVYVKKYTDSDIEYRFVGETPIEAVRFPIDLYCWKFEKEGYVTLEFACSALVRSIERILYKEMDIPEGMVFVPAGERAGVKLDDFFIDKFEVSNEQYKEFVDHGGYQKKEYWTHPFVKNGESLNWEEAITEFKDLTGRTGPSTWEAGSYPSGQGQLPVSGVSWYEAAAYAEYIGKSLPTVHHFERAVFLGLFDYYFIPAFLSKSNLNGNGPVSARSKLGMGPFGTYNMAGNVREWCWNDSQGGKCIKGGAWDDYIYLFRTTSRGSPFDRSQKNGIRCVQYINNIEMSGDAFRPIDIESYIDYTKEKAVNEEVFNVYKSQFFYDPSDLDEQVEKTDKSDKDWIKEKISFNAPYGDERIVAYLYLPKAIDPPFQTIVYFPGAGARDQVDSSNMGTSRFDLLIRSGRALIFPVYYGTYEKSIGHEFNQGPTHKYRDDVIRRIQELRRSIDFLETRSDINRDKLAFYGHSWGARMGTIIAAIEDRIKVAIFSVGGFNSSERVLQEINPINYVSRIAVPVLMLNGRFDFQRPFEVSVGPYYDLIRTKEPDKKLVIFEAGHVLPKHESAREILDWLDKYLGPVR